MSKPTQKRGAAAWRRLDNAAKIFPSATSKADTKVFRFYCELFEPVDGYYLQDALTKALADFPSFRALLKTGLFWYFLEETKRKFLVEEEYLPPCENLYYDSSSPLFRVSYYKNRINLEVYHVLTDGAGALQFLKTLVYYYILAAHRDETGTASPLDFDASASQKADDGFSKYYSGGKYGIPKMKNSQKIYYLKGPFTFEGRLRIIEGFVPSDKVLVVAKEHDVTVTAFLTAVLMRSIFDEMNEREKIEKCVSVSIPVNLHKYFPSKTVRNFFSVVNIAYDFNGGKDIWHIAEYVAKSLEENLKSENIQRRLDSLSNVERWMVVRFVPIFIKNIVLRYFYHLSEKQYTTTISNLGLITLPKGTEGYVKRIGAFNSTKDLQVCLCTYGNEMTISFTSRILSSDIQRHFFRQLAALGIPVEITANKLDLEGEL